MNTTPVPTTNPYLLAARAAVAARHAEVARLLPGTIEYAQGEHDLADAAHRLTQLEVSVLSIPE